MICSECQTPNPEGTANCLACQRPLEPNRSSSPRVESMLTVDAPSSLKEWAEKQAVYSRAESLILPEGLEIGNRYTVVRLLGIGGMGAVYRVRDRELDRDAALKLIRSDIAENAATLERFKREIQLSSKITHRNVLRVYDLGESDGIKFLTMEFVEGEDLGSLLKREGKLPFGRALDVLRQVCEGLHAAHEAGVIHRDLKPQNIMLDRSGRVHLTDFGLAKSLEQSGMTQTGALLGTPFYMSPEQVKGNEVDRRSDIYSLGIILYQMVTGALPYTGDTPYEVMSQRLHRPPRPVVELNPEAPVYLRKIIERCLALDPSLRYGSAAEVLADLESGTFRPTLRYQVRRRRWVLPAGAATLGAALLALGVVWWLTSRETMTPGPSEPRSVLIADFSNQTGDLVFDGTLEPALAIALEGASFITSYDRRSARRIAAQLQPGASGLAEPLARLVAVREGINVITAGSVARRNKGYVVSVRAVDAGTGKPFAIEEEKASGKQEVLTAVAKLATRVRAALGDTTPLSAQMAAAETFTAGSLEAAHEYALAQDLQWAGQWDDAIRHYSRAVELDPNLGRAYAGIAAVENNRGRRPQAEKYYKLALARIDRMSDREKYRTRGGYYLLTRKPDSAVEEFSALVRKYPADTAGIANLAAAYFFKRDMARALEEGRRAIEIYPKNVPQRNNYGLYAMYAGDFETAVREQQKVLELNREFALAYVGLALSQLAAGQPGPAAETWHQLEALGARGQSLAASGLADMALSQGRVEEARAILEKAIPADLAAGNSDEAARKLTTLAEAHLARGEPGRASAAAERARATSSDDAVAVSAARVFVETGEEKKADAIAAELENRLEPDPQMYARLIRGEVQRRRRSFSASLQQLKDAQKLADSWLVRLALGRTYLDAGAFTEADTQLEACLGRQGEAVAVYLDEVPTTRLLPPVHYYLGRAREGLKSPAAAEAFRAFLAFKTASAEAMVADARARLGGR